MSSLPIRKFRHEMPASRYRNGNTSAAKEIWQARIQDSSEETRGAAKGWNDYFAGFREADITTPEGAFTVLVKGGSDGTAAAFGNEPWQCTKLADQKVRVYPSAIADGAGNHEWPTYEDLPSGPETYFDIQLPPSPLAGWIYLECTVDDSDDYHGLIVSAKLVAGERPTVFLGREGTKVCIPIAEYLLSSDGSFGLDPRRCMVFTLRRYGPPGSFTWDVEPS